MKHGTAPEDHTSRIINTDAARSYADQVERVTRARMAEWVHLLADEIDRLRTELNRRA